MNNTYKVDKGIIVTQLHKAHEIQYEGVQSIHF